MKDYKEMTKCVLEARNAYEAKNGKKQMKSSEVHEAKMSEDNKMSISPESKKQKKVIWHWTTIFGGLAAAVMIGIIVSDYSADRVEEETTEIISEATEEEVTETIQEEASTAETKEQRENKKEIQKETQKEAQKETQKETQKEIQKEIQKEEVKDNQRKQNQDVTKETKEEDKKSDVQKDQQQQQTDSEKASDINYEDQKEESGDRKSEIDLTENPGTEQNETKEEPETTVTPYPPTAQKQWKKVLEGEGGITYVVDPLMENSMSAREYNLYRKYYKGMRTADCAYYDIDGCVCTDYNPAIDDITLEMLQATDFTNVKKNLQDIEEKMFEVGYKRYYDAPYLVSEPTIRRNTENNGPSLVCSIEYARDYSRFDEEKEKRFVEIFGCSSYGPEGHSWIITIDLITEEIVGW